MPRLSLWKEGAHSNDYQYMDGIIREQMIAGGTTINVHKFIGTGAPLAADAGIDKWIQDLTFLENRDRKYDKDIYPLRGVYNVSDIDFDLSQFGLFLQNDTLFIVLHYNDMIELVGRKVVSGDVIELPHLQDYYPNSTTVDLMKKYYVVQDAAKASEGYSPTWWPHLWRIKAVPIVNSQEYKDILDNDGTGNGSGANNQTYINNISINDAVISEALKDVPKAGYDTDHLYTLPLNDDASPKADQWTTADTAAVFADNDIWTSDKEGISPKKSAYDGYLTGDGLAPNGFPVEYGIIFPELPNEGDFFLRTDYKPNRLFRWNGKKWVKIEDNVRTSQLPDGAQNLKGTFVNNPNSTVLSDGQTLIERQTLSQLLAPKTDDQ